jgi:hypothetical protein
MCGCTDMVGGGRGGCMGVVECLGGRRSIKNVCFYFINLNFLKFRKMIGSVV